MLEVTNLPARLDIRHWKGDDLYLELNVASVSGSTETPVDFTGYTGQMVLERPGTDTAVLTFDTDSEMVLEADGDIKITVDKDVLSAGLTLGKYDFRITLSSPGDFTRTYFAGSFKFEFK